MDIAKFLHDLPDGLRKPLLKNYQNIVNNYLEGKWDAAGLSGGRFCETVYSIIFGVLNNGFPEKPFKPSDMQRACRDLEKTPLDPKRIGDRSLRILIPRAIQLLYEIRNNRGIGHEGGDVDANFIDCVQVYSLSSWILAELVRIFYKSTLDEAQQIVNALVERKLPLVWNVGSNRRVLDASISKTDQTLLLLYSLPSSVEEKELMNWVEYSNLTIFRNKILKPLHKKRFVEFDTKLKSVRLSPLGALHVGSIYMK